MSDYMLWFTMIGAMAVALWVSILWLVGDYEVALWVARMDEAQNKADHVSASRGLVEVMDKRGVVISRAYVRGNRDRT